MKTSRRFLSALTTFFRRMGFVQGMALGLTCASLLAYAATLTSFTGGTTISATAMNGNFSALNSELATLQTQLTALQDKVTTMKGAILRMGANKTLTCGAYPSVYADYQTLDFDLVDHVGSYVAANGKFVVTEAGQYALSGSLTTSGGGGMLSAQLAINGVLITYINTYSFSDTRYYNVGDEIELLVGCDSKSGMYPTVVFDGSVSRLSFKPL